MSILIRFCLRKGKVMAKKSILRGLARLIVAVIISICAWMLPPSCRGWVTGAVGCIVVDIYGILIEKGKL